MPEPITTYSPEVAARLREFVFELESELRDLEEASRANLGLAIGAKCDKGEIPDDMIVDGLHFLAREVADRAGALFESYYELHAMVVRGVLPESDAYCRERKERTEPKLALRLGSREDA